MEPITLFLGPRGCGKSVHAERLAAHLTRPLYVGTLPVTSRTASVIQRHKARRGPNWHLYEVGGNLAGDTRELDQTLRECDGCFVDGLIMWSFQLAKSGRLMAAAEHLSAELVDLIQSHRSVPWYLVAISVSALRREGRLFEAAATQFILNSIVDTLSPKIWVWEDGRPRIVEVFRAEI